MNLKIEKVKINKSSHVKLTRCFFSKLTSFPTLFSFQLFFFLLKRSISECRTVFSNKIIKSSAWWFDNGLPHQLLLAATNSTQEMASIELKWVVGVFTWILNASVKKNYLNIKGWSNKKIKKFVDLRKTDFESIIIPFVNFNAIFFGLIIWEGFGEKRVSDLKTH